MSHWHTKDKSALISTSHPTSYADRLRIRQPGDAGFALGPHIDSGSCERWEEDGYGRGHVYDSVFQGNWEAYDPWESSCRLPVVSDLYNGAGACSMFRIFQGWLSMSETGPGEGTLIVNPLFEKATAYYLMRPFFRPRRSRDDAWGSTFLDDGNWTLEAESTPVLQAAVPGNCQELNDVLHPHLALGETMVHVPRIRPGDYVAWHCDSKYSLSYGLACCNHATRAPLPRFATILDVVRSIIALGIKRKNVVYHDYHLPFLPLPSKVHSAGMA